MSAQAESSRRRSGERRRYVEPASDEFLEEAEQVLRSEFVASSPAPLDPDWEATAVKDVRLDQNGEREYLVEWLPTTEEYPDSWAKACDISEGILLDFARNGERPTFIEEYEDARREALEEMRKLQREDLAAGNPYHQSLLKGYWAVAERMHPETVPGSRHHRRAFLGQLEAFRHGLAGVLAACSYQALLGLTGSGLLKKKRANPEVAAFLSTNLGAAENRPCIYVFEFVDKMGLGPTKMEMAQIIQVAFEYADDNESHFLPTSKQLITSEAARNNLDDLLARIDHEIGSLAPHERVPFILREVGYTDSATNRRQQHRDHQSSNYLMMLFECISRYLNFEYRNRFEVIFLCFKYEHAPLGEIVFTLMSQSYTDTGRGFNYASAGISVNSRDKYDDKWVGWLHEMFTNPDRLFQINVEKERERIDAFKYRASGQELADIQAETRQYERDYIVALKVQTELYQKLRESHRELVPLQRWYFEEFKGRRIEDSDEPVSSETERGEEDVAMTSRVEEDDVMMTDTEVDVEDDDEMIEDTDEEMTDDEMRDAPIS